MKWREIQGDKQGRYFYISLYNNGKYQTYISQYTGNHNSNCIININLNIFRKSGSAFADSNNIFDNAEYTEIFDSRIIWLDKCIKENKFILFNTIEKSLIDNYKIY